MDITSWKELLYTFALLSPRMITAFSIVPFLGGSFLRGHVRTAIVLSFCLVLFPLLAPTAPTGTGFSLQFVAIIVKEVILGVLLGFVSSIVFWVAESVGFFIDNQRGTTMASVVDPATGSQTSPLGSMLSQVLIVLFYSGGGFLLFLGALFESYRVWPIAEALPQFDKDFALFFLQQADNLMFLTVLLAAPVIIAVFLSELGLGLINRFAPQLNVFFLSMPIKSGIASAMLILYIAVLTRFLEAEFISFKTLNQFVSGVFQ